MATRDKTQARLHDFGENLKPRIRAWLRANDVRQKELAGLLGVSPSLVSKNLREHSPMSEDFIRRLSAEIPDFSGEIYAYFQLKSGQPLPADTQKVIKAKVSISKKVTALRAAEKEVIAAIQALTDAAVKAVEGE